MSREHPNILRSEIKSETGIKQDIFEVYRKKIIRTFMDTVEGDKRHDYDSRLIREFNNRCDQLGFEHDIKITPFDGGFTYTGNLDGIPAPVANNQLLNENFTGNNSQSTATPGAYTFLIENHNGHPIGAYSSTMAIGTQMLGWYYHSPMFTNTSNYKSLTLGQLMSKESYNLLESGQLLGYGDFMQNRVLKLFGQNNALLSPGQNNDVNRELNRLMYNGIRFTTPITMMGNTIGAPQTTGDFQTGYWCRYDLTYNFGGSIEPKNNLQRDFSPTVPTGTTGISFGCYVKVEKDDPLLPLNFGGMYIRQITGSGDNQTDFVDVLQVKGSNFSQSQDMMGTTNYSHVSGNSGCYNWGNGRSLAFETSDSTIYKIRETFPGGSCGVRALQTKLQTDANDWLLLSGRTPYITGVGLVVNTGFNAVLFYGENHSYLGSGVEGLNPGNAGAMLFSQPFVQYLS